MSAKHARHNPKPQDGSATKSTNDGNRTKDLSSMLINGNLTQSTYQRLTSLAPPRDLTLGGNKTTAASKKLFTPNLNVVRNKNINVKTSKDMTAVRGRGRGRGTSNSDRGRQNVVRVPAGLIQTTGVFSEGAGKLPLKTSFNNSARIANEETKHLRKPILVKNELKVQKSDKFNADMDSKLRDILGEDVDDSFHEKTDINMRPVKLQQYNWNLKSNMIKTEIKMEKIEENTSSNDVTAADMAKQFEDMHVQLHKKRRQQELMDLEREQEQFFRPQSIEEFLKSTAAQLFLLQLPQELPCDVDDNDSEWDTKKADNADISTTTTTSTAETDSTSTMCTTRDTPSPTSNEKLFNKNPSPCGRVGKLVRYKSGKIKLVLGSTQFDLDMGLDTGIPQDLMLIDVDDGSLTGNITKLGPLRAKFTAEPDWDYLLQQQRPTKDGKK